MVKSILIHQEVLQSWFTQGKIAFSVSKSTNPYNVIYLKNHPLVCNPTLF